MLDSPSERLSEREITMRSNNNNRITKAKDLVKDRVERIYDIYEEKNFVIIIGLIGGDLVEYRVYDDGRVVEK